MITKRKKNNNNVSLLLVTVFLGFNRNIALYYIAMKDYFKCLKILLDVGVNINKENNYGQIAFIMQQINVIIILYILCVLKSL